MFGRARAVLPQWERARRSVPVAAGGPLAATMGPDPDRVLVLGGAAAAGLGVATQADGLAGRLAGGLAMRTGRGAVVESIGRVGASTSDIADLVPVERLSRFDAVVVIGGMAEALQQASTAAWQRGLADLLDRIGAAVSSGCCVVVTTLPPPSSVGPLTGGEARRADRSARVLNRATDATVRAREGTVLVRLDEHAAPVAAPTARTYQMWAEQIAARLSPLLDATVDELPGHAARRSRDPEPQRSAALARTGLTPESVDRFQDLAARARDLLGGEVAAVGFIDAESHWYTSTGETRLGSMPRSISPCDHTVGSSTGLLIGDLALDPRFDDNPLVTGEPHLRFYAGYPIESHDGYRIGSICVLGSAPRDPATVDLAALQHLAHEARLRL